MFFYFNYIFSAIQPCELSSEFFIWYHLYFQHFLYFFKFHLCYNFPLYETIFWIIVRYGYVELYSNRKSRLRDIADFFLLKEDFKEKTLTHLNPDEYFLLTKIESLSNVPTSCNTNNGGAFCSQAALFSRFSNLLPGFHLLLEVFTLITWSLYLNDSNKH